MSHSKMMPEHTVESPISVITHLELNNSTFLITFDQEATL